jgi:hypothetical protein
MKTSRLLFATFLFCSLFGSVNSTFSQGTAFTYEGRLNNTGAPASGSYDFVFSLYNDPSTGTQQGTAQTNGAVAVSNGLFTTTLDFGAGPFNGQLLWLQLLVRTNSSSAFTPLTPRQPLTPTPYSITASNLSGPLPASQISGTILNSSLPSSPSFAGIVSAGNGFSGNGSGLVNVNATTLGGLPSSSFWQLGGNSGTSPGAQFLGTPDDKALEFKVNGGRALRLEPNGTSPNVIGGYRDNLVIPGVSGATISGGGQLGLAHTVIGGFGVVGGGLENVAGNLGVVSGGQHGRATALRSTVGGGGFNEAGGVSSTVAGGEHNVASGDLSSIGGGSANEASEAASVGGGSNNIATGAFSGVAGGQQNSAENTYGFIGGGVINTNTGYAATVAGGSHNLSSFNFATVGGGQLNIANGHSSTVGGGLQNISSGQWATVPGGFINTAAGDYSFAAGHQAKANHTGAFVWSDSVFADFASTGPNQFLIRAGGGVGINTTSPTKTLDVWDGIADRGSIHVGGPGANGDPKLISFGDADYVHIGENGADDTLELKAARYSFQQTMNYGNIGVGIATPLARIHLGLLSDSASQVPQIQIDCPNAPGGTFVPAIRMTRSGFPAWDIVHYGEIYFNANGINAMIIDPSGHIFAKSFTETSDRNAKENFATVDSRVILESVVKLPIQTWSFKKDKCTPHIGPMAQDFYAAFHVGIDDKHIAMVDADGVALAAIQGLHLIVKEKDAEIQVLKQRLVNLEKKNDERDARLARLEKALESWTQVQTPTRRWE